MTFSKKRINLTFRFGQGAYGEDGFDTVTLKGLRCSALVTKTGGASNPELDLRVWGMTLDLMNRLTILNQRLDQNRHNVVIVEAGDDNGMAFVFGGTIIEGWADMSAAPETCFVVRASTAYTEAIRPVPPTSYSGNVDIAFAVAAIGLQMDPPRSLENSGVTGVVHCPYLPGTLIAQARKLQQLGNFYMIIEHDTIAIWPKDGVRGGQIPLISADTGMVGYPSYTNTGISVTCLFNPSIVFGGAIQVQSILAPASAKWTPFFVGHDLEAEIPGGKWFTHMSCSSFGQPIPVSENG